MAEILAFVKWLLSEGKSSLPWALLIAALFALYKVVTSHIKTLKEASTAGHGWSATIESLEASFTTEIGRLSARIHAMNEARDEMNIILEKARKRQR